MNTNKQTLSIAFDDSLLSLLKPQGKAKLSRSDAFIDILRRVRAAASYNQVLEGSSSGGQEGHYNVAAENGSKSSVDPTAENKQNGFVGNGAFMKSTIAQQNEIAQHGQTFQHVDDYSRGQTSLPSLAVSAPSLPSATSPLVSSPSATSKQSPLQQTTPTQCVINYTHLAHDWQWDRATVRSFLENLEQAGVILLETNGKKIILYV